MNGSPQWPVRHILLGIPVILVIATLLGAALEDWRMGKATILAAATLTSPVALVYTFLITLAERSYMMVFWAMEKTKGLLAQAQDRGEARGRTQGEARRDQEWRAWYERQQAAFRQGQPFNEPPPPPPENRQGG